VSRAARGEQEGQSARELIRRTAQGEHTHHQASVILERLEEELAGRIGQPAADALRDVLETSWGAPPVLQSPPSQDRQAPCRAVAKASGCHGSRVGERGDWQGRGVKPLPEAIAEFTSLLAPGDERR
jgi:hypothetical protein